MKILVLHGPNLNLFGRREPHIYGTRTLAEINDRLVEIAGEIGAELIIHQSNHEGTLVDHLHANIDSVNGALINPAGLTQHAVSLHDAIKAMPSPVIEVHMSNIEAREDWRGHSIISPAVQGTIQGLGWHSYTTALRALIEILEEANVTPKR